MGAVLGFFFGLFDWVEPLVSGAILSLYGLVIGLVMGGIAGLVGQALSGGRRDFSSLPRLDASRFEVLADVELADQAAALLPQSREGVTGQVAS